MQEELLEKGENWDKLRLSFLEYVQLSSPANSVQTKKQRSISGKEGNCYLLRNKILSRKFVALKLKPNVTRKWITDKTEP